MGAGGVWRLPGSDHGPGARAKKTACGVCGQEHGTFYDRKIRPIRDLSCGDTRVYLEVEFRGVPASGVPQLWSCEAGEAELDRRQSVIHQTVCLLCGEAMPGVDAERRSQGTAPGLADGQEPGDATHARATPSRGNARTVGDWD